MTWPKIYVVGKGIRGVGRGQRGGVGPYKR